MTADHLERLHRRIAELEAENDRLAAAARLARNGGDQSAAASAQRAAEAALVLSEARLRLAAEAGQVGVFELDLLSGDLTWDDRMRELFGLSAGAPVTREAASAALSAADRERLNRAVDESIAAKERQDWAFEYPVQPLDGSARRMISARWRVIVEDGRPARLVGTAVDVTLHREAQAVLARDKADLENLVAARTRDLQTVQARLAHAQRMDALGQLAGGIAHDFNNVLHAVQGGAALLERRAGDPEKVRSLAQMITEAAERGAAVTRRLLAFSRRGDLRAEPVDAGSLFASLRDMLASALGSRIDIRLEVEPNLPPLMADKAQIETMLVNLATNARDAMPEGGTLVFGARLESPGIIAITARDTGTGMTPDVAARATEPFFTTKPRGKGTGLGLSMARGFAEQSGGSLDIESTPARGTTVTARFPAARGEVPRPPPDGDAVPPRGRGERVLLVDDDAVVRAVTAEQLTGTGFQVVQAERGTDALVLLESGERFDILISDLSMPGMDGLAVIREARRRVPGLPAILLTGFASSAAELATADAERAGFTLLRKPTSEAELVGSVARLVQG